MYDLLYSLGINAGLRILKDAGDKCGYDYIGTHSLRKTFEPIIFNEQYRELIHRIEEDIRNSLKNFRL